LATVLIGQNHEPTSTLPLDGLLDQKPITKQTFIHFTNLKPEMAASWYLRYVAMLPTSTSCKDPKSRININN
jgi:hypothetical protein